MYTHNMQQLELAGFSLPRGGELSPENKWIKVAKLIPWEQFEAPYTKAFVKLLNKARAKSEESIDILLKARDRGHQKPRT